MHYIHERMSKDLVERKRKTLKVIHYFWAHLLNRNEKKSINKKVLERNEKRKITKDSISLCFFLP